MLGEDATILSTISSTIYDEWLSGGLLWPYVLGMTCYSPGTTTVIFISRRTGLDDGGYSNAATEMGALAALQPGYLGVDSVRDTDGVGITVSYWVDDAAAKAWRDHPDHIAIRNKGRGIWYEDYSLHVASVTRSYDWAKAS